MNPKRLFLKLLIVSVVISSLVGIGILLFGNFGHIEVRVLFSTLTITVTSVFGLACGAYLESGRGRVIAITGIGLAVVGALMCFLIIWNVLDNSEVFVKAFLTATLLASACSYLSLLSLARLDQRFSWTRIAAVACVGLLSTILLYILWFEPQGQSDLVYRVLGVLGIVLASITVVTPILHRLSSGEPDTDALDREIAELEKRLDDVKAKRSGN